MAKRKMINGESEIGDVRVTRRSTRVKTTKEEPVDEKPVKKTKTTKATMAKGKPLPIEDEQAEDEKEEKKNATQPTAQTNATQPPKTDATGAPTADEAAVSQERQYWLMKAEPESRLEKGHDVKFSIDDLAAKTEPEPWDGIRNYAARNNLRAMKKGDLAFFYHSSCKTPAIVGIMEIVQEHSPDYTAQDPKAAYHDPKDKDPSNPKWSVVHVVFRQKFPIPLTLSELKILQSSAPELKDLQLLKQSRLSVSRVSRQEWQVLVRAVGRREQALREGVEGGEGCILRG
ncbi:hypothetical protein VE03_01317 [Pseudogymnoascus sp. 23342-1-I1]|nr:hypothetical protein VE03_01317 [Pseudogymnoascus sp. 23342-1-I1]